MTDSFHGPVTEDRSTHVVPNLASAGIDPTVARPRRVSRWVVNGAIACMARVMLVGHTAPSVE